MIYQDDPLLPDEMHHMACRVCAIALAREVIRGIPWTAPELADAWAKAKAQKIINQDLIVVDDPALFELLGVPLRAVPVESLAMPTVVDENDVLRVAQATEPLDSGTYWVLERWFWKQSHFVKGRGVNYLPPEYDPIEGGSLTRGNGSLLDLRVFVITR